MSETQTNSQILSDSTEHHELRLVASRCQGAKRKTSDFRHELSWLTEHICGKGFKIKIKKIVLPQNTLGSGLTWSSCLLKLLKISCLLTWNTGFPSLKTACMTTPSEYMSEAESQLTDRMYSGATYSGFGRQRGGRLGSHSLHTYLGYNTHTAKFFKYIHCLDFPTWIHIIHIPLYCIISNLHRHLKSTYHRFWKNWLLQTSS